VKRGEACQGVEAISFRTFVRVEGGGKEQAVEETHVPKACGDTETGQSMSWIKPGEGHEG